MKRSPVLLAAMRRMRGVRADSESDSSCDAAPPRWRPMTPPLDESGNPRHATVEFEIDRASLTANIGREERGVSPRSPGGLLGDIPLSSRTCHAEAGAPSMWVPTTPEQSPSPDNFRDFFRSIEHCNSTTSTSRNIDGSNSSQMSPRNEMYDPSMADRALARKHYAAPRSPEFSPRAAAVRASQQRQRAKAALHRFDFYATRAVKRRQVTCRREELQRHLKVVCAMFVRVIVLTMIRNDGRCIRKWHAKSA